MTAALIAPWGHRTRLAVWAIAVLASAAPAFAQQPAGTTIDRIKKSGKIRLGYREDARPFSFRDAAGSAAGYSVMLCQKVADAVKAELAMPALATEWVTVPVADRFAAVQQGRVDLFCGADAQTITRRKDVSFSIPIFASGIGAVLRKDAAARLKDVLSGKPQSSPTWRAQAGQLLQAQVFTVVTGTTAESWLNGKMKEFNLSAGIRPVDDYQTGLQRVVDRQAQVFFGDRAILLGALAASKAGTQLMVLDRYFTNENVSLTLARGDDAFRLVVDRTLSRLYVTPEFRTLYVQWFSEPTENALTFYRLNALPE
ncbi:MAG TPA: amino acid ABC transporter substrate-binding protein [Gemmatimonadales bacterium]|nr:amino acid ABC transporter substrate-binding protein [Gemmatimonadales bacterium]